MGWFGKVMGGTLGFLFGGPLGAVCGAVLGHTMFDKYSESLQEYRPPITHEQTQAIYFVSLFSILGKLSKIDGVVSQAEIRIVEDFIDQIRLSGQQRKFAIDIFREAKNSPYAIEDFAVQFYEINRGDPAILLTLTELLLRIAAADGKLDPSEESAIEKVRRIFHIGDQQFTNLKMSYFDHFDKYYRRLNCAPEATNEEIKRNYRKLVSEFHPDKIISKGLPEEFVNFATERFQEIQEAYEKIRAQRGF
jgi:DnaJ like chaperone protein